MILTFISVANANIVKYRYHSQQAWGPVEMRAFWVGEDEMQLFTQKEHLMSSRQICITTDPRTPQPNLT